MILAHKIKLNPTDEQIETMKTICNACIHAYNWGLYKSGVYYEEWKISYERVKDDNPDMSDKDARKLAGKRKSGYDLKKEFRAVKKVEFDWVSIMPSSSVDQVFVNINSAFTNFFRRLKNGDDKLGFPKRKSYYNPRKSFYLSNTSVRLRHVDGHNLRLPKVGIVNMTEELRFNGKLMSTTVSTDGLYWYASFSIDVPDTPVINNNPPVGVDVGIKEMAVCSDGFVAVNNKHTKRYERQLAQLQRKLARQQKGSGRYNDTKKRISKVHKRIANSRKHDTHTATTHIAQNASIICIEDLNVKGMVKNRKLSKAVHDANMGEFHRQLDYKSKLNGGYVVKIGRWFPSSKTCSACSEVKKDLTLSDRLYICESCGIILDRDLNASINIRDEGLRILESGK